MSQIHTDSRHTGYVCLGWCNGKFRMVKHLPMFQKICAKGIGALQNLCDSLPNGKVNILLREREMPVQFTWDVNVADSLAAPAENSVYQLYSLSGGGKDIEHYTCGKGLRGSCQSLCG